VYILMTLQLFECCMRKIFLAVVLLVTPNLLVADKSWQRSSVELVQAKLNDLGYSAGPVDGAWGRKTSSALNLYCEEYEHDCLGGEETVIDLLTADTDDSYLDVKMDLASAVWFENRIGYGAPKDRVDRYVGMTRREAVDLVVQELKDYQDPFELPSWFYEMKPLGRILQLRQGNQCDTTYLKLSIKEAWLSALYQSEVPQFDRLSVFWLDHFSVGYDAYEHPHAFGRHLQFVRDWKAKSFPELLYASLSDPSTIVYLNNDKSDRNTPNENLAREFFELFALGEGNYSENDVREFAKLLTGRAFNLAGEKYQFMNERAIKPNAKLFGKRYTKAETLVQSLKDHPDYGHFIIQKLYNEYVSLDDVSDIQMRLLKHRFLKNEQSILALFESIISSNDFWNTSGQLTLIKSPLDLFAGTSRTLNTTGSLEWDSRYWPRLATKLKAFDQDIFDPLSIEGWPEGKEWLQGSALDRRMEELQNLFLSELQPSRNPISERRAGANWEFLKREQTRKAQLEAFFASAKKNQLLIEDMIIESDRDFQRDEFFQIRVVFKNVQFNKQIFDHISLNLNYRPDSEHYRNHAQFYKEMVPENFLKKAKYHGSDGDTVHIGISLPMEGKLEKGLKRSEAMMIENLIKSLSIFLDKKDSMRFRSEMILMGPEGRKWLRGILKSHGALVDVYDHNSPVRLFFPSNLISPGNNGTTNFYFDCNSLIGKSQKTLEQYFEYSRMKMSYDNFSPIEFSEVRTKIWKNKPSKYDTVLNKYLLPEFANLDEPVSLLETISLVEYNLR